MSSKDQIISDILDVDLMEGSNPFPVKYDENTNLPAVKTEVVKADPLLDEDFRRIRENMQEISRLGMIGLDTVTRVAAGTENPDSFDAMSKMLKEVTKIQKETLEAYKLRLEIDEIKQGLASGQGSKKKVDSVSSVNVDKAVFVGSPSDLLRKLDEEDGS